MDDDNDTGKTKSFYNCWEIYTAAACFCFAATMLLLFMLPQIVHIMTDMIPETRHLYICFAIVKVFAIILSTIYPLVCFYEICRFLIVFMRGGGTKKVEPLASLPASMQKEMEQTFQSYGAVGSITILHGTIAIVMWLNPVINAWEDVKHSKYPDSSRFVAYCYTLCCFLWILLTILYGCKTYWLFTCSSDTKKVDHAV